MECRLSILDDDGERIVGWYWRAGLRQATRTYVSAAEVYLKPTESLHRRRFQSSASFQVLVNGRRGSETKKRALRVNPQTHGVNELRGLG